MDLVSYTQLQIYNKKIHAAPDLWQIWIIARQTQLADVSAIACWIRKPCTSESLVHQKSLYISLVHQWGPSALYINEATTPLPAQHSSAARVVASLLQSFYINTVYTHSALVALRCDMQSSFTHFAVATSCSGHRLHFPPVCSCSILKRGGWGWKGWRRRPLCLKSLQGCHRAR